MLPAVSAGLAVSGLRVSYGPTVVVDGVDLQVAPGEVVSLVGESGCGKSTLLRAVARLLPPGAQVEGRVTWAGAPITAWPEFRRGVLGVMFQEPGEALNPTRSVRAQVQEALPQLPAAERGRAAAALLLRAGFSAPDVVLGAYPHQLSGGQRQRVLAALAIARDPALLLLDEPVAHLDATVAVDVLHALLPPGPRAALWVTHDLAWAAQRADRVVVMYAGRVVEVGAAAAVLAAPRHPYTAGLVAALPRPGRPLQPIPGAPPALAAPPPGCRFHPRCPRADPRCRTEVPALAPGRNFACHHPLEEAS
jgi:peptide/nickel transport system ATP-binding protein